MLFGTQLPRDEYRPRHDGVGSIETTPAGNVALRIGRELAGPAGAGGQWEQVAYVVLTPLEARALASELLHNHGGEEEGRRQAEAREGYCTCGEPVMDVEHDAGCRRCGRPVDFTPAGPPAPPFACDPDESAGVREELQRANELAAFAEATAFLVCPDCGADTFATRDADGDLAAVCSNDECPRVFVAGSYAELRARLAREAGELRAGRDPRD